VHRDQIVRAEEEVDVVRRKAVVATEMDAMEDDVEVAVVGLGLWILERRPRIIDR
jgi:hypothetical protein